MAHYNDQIKNMSNDSSKFKYMKKITQILLPLSLFSLFFSKSSLFLDSYDYLISNLSLILNSNFNLNFKFKLFTYTTERNCIFLLCNGILVFIIQSSGLISKITPLDSSPKPPRLDDHPRFEEIKEKGVGKVEILEEKSNLSSLEEENLHNCEVEKWDEHDEDEDDVHDDEDEEGIDTEELKKKFEDFIKKVKMEIQGA